MKTIQELTAALGGFAILIVTAQQGATVDARIAGAQAARCSIPAVKAALVALAREMERLVATHAPGATSATWLEQFTNTQEQGFGVLVKQLLEIEEALGLATTNEISNS